MDLRECTAVQRLIHSRRLKTSDNRNHSRERERWHFMLTDRQTQSLLRVMTGLPIDGPHIRRTEQYLCRWPTTNQLEKDSCAYSKLQPNLSSKFQFHGLPQSVHIRYIPVKCSLWILNPEIYCRRGRGIIHRVPKKPKPLMFDNNFGKCGPIFKILSPGDL